MVNRSWVRLGTFLCAITIVTLGPCATAADLAVLRNGFTIRHEHRVTMGDTTRLFFSSDDSNFLDVPTSEISAFEKELILLVPPSPDSTPGTRPTTQDASRDLNQLIDSASTAYHLDPDLVNSVIHAESNFNAQAVSPKGARGLMQLMPSTAGELGVNDAFDPQENVGGGSKYLRELLEHYNYDLVKALAAYNAGPERVEQYKGVPPFHETQAYVARIVHEYNRKKVAQERFAATAKKQRTLSATKPSAGTRTRQTATVKQRTDSQVPRNSASSVSRVADSASAVSQR